MSRTSLPKATTSKKELDVLLKTGIHFGHKKSRCHPSMSPYIYGKRNDIYIIDLEKIKSKLAEALQFIETISNEGKEIVFVGTKPNVCEFLKETGSQNQLLYISERWIGGTLTNFATIKKRLKYFQELRDRKTSDDFAKLTKKEKRDINKQIEHLEKSWRGVQELSQLPEALFLLDVPNNYLAIREAKKKGVKVIGICDTDADIRHVDYPIPANDDSLLAIKYIVEKCVEAVKRGRETKESSAKSQTNKTN